MKEEIQSYQLQYLINQSGIVGNYEIINVENKEYNNGSSQTTNWKTNLEGNIVEFDTEIIWNDENPPTTKNILKFLYRTEYQIHLQTIHLDRVKDDKLIWNLAELLFRHKCLIQQLFLEHKQFKDNNFPHSTESFYWNYQEVKQRLK